MQSSRSRPAECGGGAECGALGAAAPALPGPPSAHQCWHHQLPSTPWYWQHPCHTGPMAPTAPQRSVCSPMAPMGLPGPPSPCSCALLDVAPHVSLLSPWPYSLCPTVHVPLVPLPLVPPSPVPLVPMATSPVSPVSLSVPPRCPWSPPLSPHPEDPECFQPQSPEGTQSQGQRGGTRDSGCHCRGSASALCPLPRRHWQSQVLCPFIVVFTITFLCPGCRRAETPEGTGTPCEAPWPPGSP